MLEIRASLRIYTKGLSLSDVSDKFGYAYDFGHSEGDVISTKTAKQHTETMWGKNSTCSTSENLDTHVTELLDWLDKTKSVFHEVVSKINIKPNVFCFLSTENGQGGADISSKNMKRMSEYSLDLVLDVYA